MYLLLTHSFLQFIVIKPFYPFLFLWSKEDCKSTFIYNQFHIAPLTIWTCQIISMIFANLLHNLFSIRYCSILTQRERLLMSSGLDCARYNNTSKARKPWFFICLYCVCLR